MTERGDRMSEQRQCLNRLRSYADALTRADDKGYTDSAAPLYSALALVEIGRALVWISEALDLTSRRW